jgi:hypothetical protein
MKSIDSNKEEFYKRRENRIRNLFKKGYSKNGVYDRLYKLGLRTHFLNNIHVEDEAVVVLQINSVFNELLSSGLYKIGFNKGKNKSEKLQKI